MHPVFYLGPLEFPAYFTFLTLGYTLAVLLAHRESLKIPHLVSPVKLIDLSMILLFAGLLGARIMHVLADGYLTEYINLCVDPLATKALPAPEGFRCLSDGACVAKDLGELCNTAAGTCHQGQDCLRTLKFWYGGLAFYGGLVLATLVAIWYMRRYRTQIQFPAMADLAGFGIALGLVFGRLGCWLAGCCFGCLAHTGPAVTFPRNSPAFDRHLDLGLLTRHAHESLPVVPVQLYQLGANLLVFLAVFGLGWGCFDTNNMPILCQLVRPELRATGYGLMNLVSISCGGLADWGFGRLRDAKVPLNVTFSAIASVAIVAIVLVLLIRPRPEPVSAESTKG